MDFQARDWKGYEVCRHDDRKFSLYFITSHCLPLASSTSVALRVGLPKMRPNYASI